MVLVEADPMSWHNIWNWWLTDPPWPASVRIYSGKYKYRPWSRTMRRKSSSGLQLTKAKHPFETVKRLRLWVIMNRRDTHLGDSLLIPKWASKIQPLNQVIWIWLSPFRTLSFFDKPTQYRRFFNCLGYRDSTWASKTCGVTRPSATTITLKLAMPSPPTVFVMLILGLGDDFTAKTISWLAHECHFFFEIATTKWRSLFKIWQRSTGAWLVYKCSVAF